MKRHKLLVSARQLSEHLDDPTWRIVDCRFDLKLPDKGHADYLAGHIPGATYADLDRDLAAAVTAESGRHPLPDPADFAATLGALGIDGGTQVVAYDNSGGAIAARLWWMLRWLGHSAVAVLDGGLDAWVGSGFSLETGEVVVEPTDFVARERAEMVVTTEEVARRLGTDTTFRLIDARDQQRFVGAAEPIDTVAGHVPGAHNLPFTACLAADGGWCPAEELGAAWRSVLDGDPDGDSAVMCGSGVTACHLILSAELAGFTAPRLYVGSWSEWIRDPGRAIATGPGPGAADSASN